MSTDPWIPPAELNLAEYCLDRRLHEGDGDRVALIVADGDRPERRLSYAEVAALAGRYGGALRRLGVRREERVLIALPDGPEFVAALFGVLKIGAVGVMLNPRLGAEELAAICRYSRARLAVADGEAARTLAGCGAGNSGVGTELRTLLVSANGSGGALGDAGSEGPRRVDLAEALDPQDDGLTTVVTHRDDPALWLFSGGTTGAPKAVVQTHGSFVNTTELYARRALGYHRDDITLSVPKLFFGYATGSNLFFPFAVGGRAVLFPEPPTPDVLFGLIARYRPTILVNVPTVVQRMLAHPEAAGQDLSSLRFATSAGEALPVPLYQRWKETFGVELLDGLGTAEMWHIFVTNRPGDVRPGTLGRVVDGFDLRVRDDDGRDLPDGEVGRLWVRGRSRALGYWQDLPKTSSAFLGEWFVGGDLICRDAEGYVTYCGRDDDVVKVGGKWLVPAEVEGCLARHPAVDECAVVTVADASGLTKPYAFVLARDPSSDLEDELKAFALERLQAYKHPRRVLVVAELPRTHLGKIDRGALKRLVPVE